MRAGESYVDVGTLNGYREAMRLLGDAGDCAPDIVPPRRAGGPRLSRS